MPVAKLPSELIGKIFVTPEEAGKIMHVCRLTVIRRIQDGSLKAKKSGSKWLIPATEFDIMAKVR